MRTSVDTSLSQPLEDLGDEIVIQVETGQSEPLDHGPGRRDRPEPQEVKVSRPGQQDQG
jgi:hypothetical protein